MLQRNLLGLAQPALPRLRRRRDLRNLDPRNALRDGNRFPQRRGKGLIQLPVHILLLLDPEGRQIPVPLRRQRRHRPVRRVQHHVRGREAELQRLRRARQHDDAEHQHQRAEQRDQPVRLHAHVVDACFRGPVQLARDVLVAFDDQEGALRVLDDDVAGRDVACGLADGQLQGPLGAEADEGGEEGEEQGGGQGGAVVVDDREDGQGDGQGAAEEGQPRQRARLAGRDVGLPLILGDAQAADRVGGETVAVVQQVGDVVDVRVVVAGVGADGLADCVAEPIGSGGFDQGLRSRE